MKFQTWLEVRYFRPEEFFCKCGCRTGMKGTLPALLIFGLDRMRGQLGHPTRVNSAWRCEAHNKRVGGATNSKHLLGRAADISIISAEIKIIEGVAGDLGLRVIPYLRENFVHVEI